MLAKSLTALPIVLFAAMFLRLAGVGIAWLPSAVSLATFGLAALAFKALAIHRVQVVAAASDWRGLLDRYGFGVGLAGLALLAVLIRLPSIGADLGHQPIDIDEHRLASNVKQFFVTGELGHRTVEHYPGAFFWAVTGASLLMYLHGLMEGAFHTIRNMPLEAFVLAGRLVNTLIAAATVVVAGLIGRQMCSGAGGLVAAGLIAIAPLSVQTTTALRNDAAQVLLTCAATTPRWRRARRPPPVARARRRVRRRGDRHQVHQRLHAAPGAGGIADARVCDRRVPFGPRSSWWHSC